MQDISHLNLQSKSIRRGWWENLMRVWNQPLMRLQLKSTGNWLNSYMDVFRLPGIVVGRTLFVCLFGWLDTKILYGNGAIVGTWFVFTDQIIKWSVVMTLFLVMLLYKQYHILHYIPCLPTQPQINSFRFLISINNIHPNFLVTNIKIYWYRHLS